MWVSSAREAATKSARGGPRPAGLSAEGLRSTVPVMRHSPGSKADRALVIGSLLTAVALGCAHPGGGPDRSAPATDLIAGGGTGGDGVLATQAQLKEPFGVARTPGGDLYVVEHAAHRVRRIDARGIITTVAGTGEKADGGDGGNGALARLNGPHHILLSPAQRTDPHVLYIADSWNWRIRAFDSKTSIITTLAGNGSKGFTGDGGPAAQATTGGIYCLAFDAQGKRLFFADLDNRRIRVVDLGSGVVSTVAGNGEKGIPTDGTDARLAPLVDPRAVTVDSRGNVYIAERSGHALRVVDLNGKIRTVAGTGQKGYSGDGGPGVQAQLAGPKHLAVDRDDSVLIVDTENHVIRRYTPGDGRITNVAGTGVKGAAGLGGPPEQLQLNRPHGVFLDPNGDLLLSDSDNHRVVRIRRSLPLLSAR